MKHTYMTRCLSILLLLGALIIYLPNLRAQDLKPVSTTYVIKNATVIPAPGQSIEGADVIISDGLIAAVGKGLTVPPDGQLVDGDSLVVYAGFIDGLSHAGLEKPKRQERPNVKDPGNPPDDIAGITPYVDVRELLNQDDKSISDLRELGFTVTHTVPYGNMLPGTGAIILLGGENLVLKENASLYSQFDGARGVYPATVIGVMAKYRELYRQAAYSKNDAARYQSGNAGIKRPAANRVLEAFYPVINGTLPVAFNTEGIKDVYRAFQLKQDLGFDLMLMGLKQSWDITDMLKSSGTPVFISLDLPEWKDEKRDSTLTGSEAEEYNNLFDRKEEILKKYYGQAGSLSTSGVTFGFTTEGLKKSDFHKNILKMKDEGATEAQLLSSLTTSPASLLGLSKWLGTVESGKMANLVVTDKNFFEEGAAIRYVFVEGVQYEFEKKPAKKSKEGDDDKEVSPVGNWTLTANTGGAPATGTLKVEQGDGGYKGAITLDQDGVSYDLNDITFSDGTLEFSVIINAGGQDMPFDGVLEFTTDSYSGTVSSGAMGSVPVNGEKIPNKTKSK